MGRPFPEGTLEAVTIITFILTGGIAFARNIFINTLHRLSLQPSVVILIFYFTIDAVFPGMI